MVSIAIAAGCGSASSEHEEVEHTRPEHWPDTFIDLVEQLKHRFESRDGTSPDAELADQLKWLPEIAGDTSLNEADWNEAVTSGEQLVSVYESGGDPKPMLETLSRLAEKTRDDLPPFVPGRYEDVEESLDEQIGRSAGEEPSTAPELEADASPTDSTDAGTTGSDS